jgi:probable transcriptional regulator
MKSNLNVHNSRLFSKEIGNAHLFRSVCIDTDKLCFSPELPLWPVFLDHAELNHGQGFRHYNSTRFCLEIPLAGNLTCEQRGEICTVIPGEIYLIHYGEDSAFRIGPAGNCRKIGLGFAGLLLPSLLTETLLIEQTHLQLRNPDHFLGLVLKLEQMMRTATQQDVLELSVFSYRLILELARSVDIKQPPLLRTAIEVMKVNLSQMISIGEIAEKLDVSTSTLENLFAQHLGISPRKYLDDLRFQRAKLLLADSSLSIGQIARNLGYVHQMHFSRRFRERFNMSPSKFRKIQSVIPQKEN